MNFDSKEYLEKLDEYFRATNYLSVAQLYLEKNPLLRTPLTINDIKKRIVGHWGTVPGQNFVYAHLNRLINKYNQKTILISGPGHGGNFFIANSYLEGRYSEIYPQITEDEKGLTRLCKQFSFPLGVSSHVSPEVPGSMHEGGELGYSLSHAYGAVLDNPDLLVATIVGDGEAETGPLATSWHINKLINPKTDGTVLPILHLNGFKISNPTILARISKKELISLFVGYGYKPYLVSGSDPIKMHKLMAKTIDKVMQDIRTIKDNAAKGITTRPIWPMIILETPKGWTCPKVVDDKIIEGSFRAHQVPIPMDTQEHLDLLNSWLLSYKPNELFTNDYKLRDDLKAILPKGDMRISASPYTNGGFVAKPLNLPNIESVAVTIDEPSSTKVQDMEQLSNYLAKVVEKNSNNFRVFTPDEAKSNRLYGLFNVTKRQFYASTNKNDEDLSLNGRLIDSMLSEHICEGMLEGYNLTGRYGMFVTYESFANIVSSMTAQHAKWIKVCNNLNWRKPIPSLNVILTSHIWQQDHNGFTHQNPAFIDDISNKQSETIKIYFPPDANSLICCADHCLSTQNKINVIVASKHPSLQWLNMEQAKSHFEKGIGVWEFASNIKRGEPDVVIASCGDVATLETLACTKILNEKFPKLKIRYVNVVDLMKLQSRKNNPDGLTDDEFNKLFTKDKPVIFAYHGYPKLIHTLTYARENRNIHVSGYNEEGTITTPFDMRVQNKVDRYNLVLKALKFVPNLYNKDVEKEMLDILQKEHNYIAENGIDLPEISNWKY